ncbi:hypothetical protein PLICRDRAFT_42137 [Plicaturopsis crispa FD-325 SS-3]|nr:hypothetical protein PLICRDRAFT_42137 [Plicaturopsis crispa FD-325 SS-3]
MKVIITGASGVLGSAIYADFTRSPAEHTVLGLAHSNPRPGLTQLDLLDEKRVEEVFASFNADWVVHCAAERRPDVAEKDPQGAQKLNADLPAYLAQLSKKLSFTLIYISTDYVFDGTSPPYVPSAVTNPLQLYGRTKRAGEVGVLGVEGARAVVLRVPVLYGPAPSNSDSAINILLDVVRDQSGKKYTMDHYATRYPTNVCDIAQFLVRLSAITVNRPGTVIPPILHFSAAEPFTKYEICLIFAALLSLPHAHIVADAEAPTGKAAVGRPRDCALYTGETDALLREGEGGGQGLGCVGFEEWWREWLKEH